MHIGICDDIRAEREHLETLLQVYNSHFTISHYPSGQDLLEELSTGLHLDLLFLDIYMDGLNGMETAQKIRESNKILPIIFLTTSPDFALSAFGVRAAGYLLKPVDPAQLHNYLTDYTPPSPSPDTWVTNSTHGELSLAVHKIVYCEQQGNYGEIHMENGTIYHVRTTFADMKQQLEPHTQIIACGRSYLLNLSYVRTINRQNVLLMDGSALPVSRKSYIALREAYLTFYKGGT